MVNQVKGAYQVKELSIIKYVQKAKQLLNKLEQEGAQWEILQIFRSKNSKVDLLAKSASKANQVFKELDLTEELTKPSIEEEEVMNT